MPNFNRIYEGFMVYTENSIYGLMQTRVYYIMNTAENWNFPKIV
jgi:hypothetical protein